MNPKRIQIKVGMNELTWEGYKVTLNVARDGTLGGHLTDPDDWRTQVSLYRSIDNEDKPTLTGVNWAGRGTMSPDRAEEYAKMILAAARLARALDESLLPIHKA